MPDIDTVRLASIVITVLGILAWALFLIKHPRKWGYAVPIVLWLVHVLIFYASYYACPDPVARHDMYNLWSSALRLQAAITATGAGIILWIQR